MISNFILGESLRDNLEINDHLSDGDMEWVGENQTVKGEMLRLPAFCEGTKSDV